MLCYQIRKYLRQGGGSCNTYRYIVDAGKPSLASYEFPGMDWLISALNACQLCYTYTGLSAYNSCETWPTTQQSVFLVTGDFSGLTTGKPGEHSATYVT
jgi:hypothetical protein